MQQGLATESAVTADHKLQVAWTREALLALSYAVALTSAC